MRIGEGKRTEKGGPIVLVIRALGMAATTIEARRLESRSSDRAPTHEFFHEGVKCGALWTREEKGDRPAFLSGRLESFLFPAGALEVAVFQAKDATRAGEYDLVWNPESAGRPASSAAAPVADGGAAGPDDGDIPF